MQIAQIVPKVLTQKEDIFDYAIPPELLVKIKLGILVEIPFHGRKIEGIIINLKSKSQISNLKSIIKIIDPDPVVDEIHIKLAQWMSDYYLVPLGKTLFENIVPPARRILKKIDVNFKARPQHQGASDLPDSASHWQAGGGRGKKYLIVGNFKERLKFYQEACQKTLKQNKSIIILIPDISLLRFFENQFKVPMSVLHANLTKTQRWLQWQKIRHGQIKIVLGSQSALFAPVKNLGLIIIDQEENETYKNDRSPRFHAVKVAEKLSKISAANLILGSLTPRVETYYRALKNIYTLRKTQTQESSQITIVNTAGKYQALSLSLQEKIEENLAVNKKIILVLNRKGDGIKYACPDCGWTALCPKCGLPLTPQESQLFCFRCEKSYPPPQECPKCQSAHLKAFGLGTAKLEKFVKDFWPKTRTIRLEESSEIKQADLEKSWQIAITTSYGLKFNFPAIGLVGIIDADQGLNFPDYRAAEKNFQNFFKFLKIGKQGIIQTNLDENPTTEALAKLDYEKFFLNELAIRRRFSFPPFTKLIRLLYKNQDEDKCQKETQKVYQILKSHIDNQSLLGPSSVFIRKKRNFYRWQIIIKIQKEKNLKKIEEILKTLPKGWIVDVDPVDLL